MWVLGGSRRCDDFLGGEDRAGVLGARLARIRGASPGGPGPVRRAASCTKRRWTEHLTPLRRGLLRHKAVSSTLLVAHTFKTDFVPVATHHGRRGSIACEMGIQPFPRWDPFRKTGSEAVLHELCSARWPKSTLHAASACESRPVRLSHRC